jgi:hypothetical protein
MVFRSIHIEIEIGEERRERENERNTYKERRRQRETISINSHGSNVDYLSCSVAYRSICGLLAFSPLELVFYVELLE